METVEFLLLASIHGPCLAAVQKCTKHTGMIDVQLSLYGESYVIPELLQILVFTSALMENELEMKDPR